MRARQARGVQLRTPRVILKGRAAKSALQTGGVHVRSFGVDTDNARSGVLHRVLL